MFVFSSSNFCTIFANLLVLCEVLCSSASISPPRRSGDRHLAGFTNFVKHLEDEFAAGPAKSVQAESQPPKEMTVFRLPTHIRPLSYALKMAIDDKKPEFFGEVKINVSVSKNSDRVLLHSNRLKIKKVDLYHRNDKMSTSFRVDPVNQLLRIRPKSTLVQNEVYEIKVRFDGKLSAQDFFGIYRSAHYGGRETKYTTLTQFEPTHARRVFPCFDEPHFRATFDIRVARYQHEIVLSNMPLISTSTPDPSIDNRIWDTFDTTPPMPTYLVSFAIATDFTNISDPSGKYTLWAPKDKISEYSYAHNVLTKAVQVAEEYTGIEYMLPKLDLLAVDYFQRGAMENWGLMTFKADLVEFNENEDNSWMQHSVMSIVVHETIHQWFGNYVTISWWDTLWLKEGFATLFSYALEASIDPKWKMADFFLKEVKIKAMTYEETAEIFPMTNPVNTPAEIENQFNTVTYEKAASVLHMLRFMISPATFRKALQMYLRSGHKVGGGVTSPDDLWAACDQQLLVEKRSLGNGLTVGQTMKSWTDQKGYPIIMITRYKNGSRDDIGIKQEPFDADNEVGPNNRTRQWIVPITCAKGSNPDFNDTRPKLWLLDQKEVILPNEVGKDEWIVCNVQQTGHYRLNYDEESWGLIADVLDSSPELIHRYNRHLIINDAVTLFLSQKIPFGSVLKIISTLDHENDSLVWKTATPLVETLLWKLDGTEVYERLRQFLAKRFDKMYKKIGFHEKSTDTRELRELRPHILRTCCSLGNDDCLSNAAAEFHKHDTIDRVPPHSQYAVICAALKFNSSSDITWKKLRDYFKNQKNPLNNEDLIISFRTSKDESIVQKFLSDLRAGKTDDLQKYFLGVSLTQYHGTMAAMHFIEEMLPKMDEYKKGEKIINTILTLISVTSHEQMNLLNKMLETAMKLDPEKYKNIIKTLNDKKHEAEAKVKALDKSSAQILAALDSICQDPVLQDPVAHTKIKHESLQASSAQSTYSHPVCCSILACISWLLVATLTGLNGN